MRLLPSYSSHAYRVDFEQEDPQDADLEVSITSRVRGGATTRTVQFLLRWSSGPHSDVGCCPYRSFRSSDTRRHGGWAVCNASSRWYVGCGREHGGELAGNRRESTSLPGYGWRNDQQTSVDPESQSTSRQILLTLSVLKKDLKTARL